MTTATETVSVEELEEQFNLELPCGGNRSPRNRPCPYAAVAILECTHRCEQCPQDFKCLECYAEWLQGAWYNSDGWCICPSCFEQMRADKMYRKL